MPLTPTRIAFHTHADTLTDPLPAHSVAHTHSHSHTFYTLAFHTLTHVCAHTRVLSQSYTRTPCAFRSHVLTGTPPTAFLTPSRTLTRDAGSRGGRGASQPRV